jgi:ABC-type dipeptide/oligopeptide/nickel transport system permease subunit
MQATPEIQNTPSSVVELGAESLRSTESVTLWRTALRRLFKRKSAVVGLVMLAILTFIAIFANVLAPYNPEQVLLGVEKGIKMRQGPCIHLLGCWAWMATCATSSAGCSTAPG